MNLKTSRQKFEAISDENIRQAVNFADRYLSENAIDYEQRVRYRLLLEELLLEYRDADENASFSLVYKRRWRYVAVKLKVDGKSFNVLREADSLFSDALLSGLRNKPTWEYKRGANIVTFEPNTLVPGKEELKYVIRYMASEKRAFRTGVALRLLNMLLLTLEPILAARMITSISGSELKKILLFAALVLAVDCVNSLLNFYGTRYLNRAYRAMRNSMQADMSEKVLQMKTEHIDAHGTGVFTQRILDETVNVAEGIDEMVALLTEVFRLISLMIAFATVSGVMLAFEMVLFILYFQIVRAQARKVNDDKRHFKVAREKLTGFVGEMVRSSRDIKLLHCEESFLSRVNAAINEAADRSHDMNNDITSFTLGREQFVTWTNFLYIALLVLLMAKYGMAASTALILYNYSGRVYASARGIAGAMTTFYSLLLSAERVYQIIESRDFSKEVFGEKKLDAVKGDIELENVHFAYRHEDSPPTPVLKGLSLHIHPGESVAFVGKSGCGKSTALSLITRLYDPLKGSIKLDGTEVQELDRDSLRGSIGMVSQMPYLFNMSIRDNFAIVKSDVTDEEIVKACRTACIHEEIMKFPEGYDTLVGEGGVMLSGGQRQRIALARCLIRDYPIIMLDEATSALDNETQSQIRTAIENMQGKRTIIMIAHRLSTVVNCEKLFFLKDGKVIAAGTNKELLDSCEEYRQLYREEIAS